MKRIAICEHKQEHESVAERAQKMVLASQDIEQICCIFKMLADPTRLKIVFALLQGEMCVYHLTEACKTTQSAISHQLRILRDNKIVKAKRLGQSVEYAIADDHVREMIEIGIVHANCSVE